MSRSRLLATLFWDMFKIALFVVGGGFAILAVADDVFSRRRGWTRQGEIVAQIPLFQMIPGVIAAHTATYIGSKMAGPAGAAAALAGAVLPSILIFSAIAVGYSFIPVDNPYLAHAFAGLRAALAGIIAAMVIRTWRRNLHGAYGYCALAAATFLIGYLHIGAATVIATGAMLGLLGAAIRRDSSAPTNLRCSALGTILLLFAKYGLIAFGGGYVLVPVYLADFVGASAPLLQLSEAEFANVMALTQMTPGPIAINCATFFGYRLGGVPGALAASVAMILPGFALLLLALRYLEKFKHNFAVKGMLRGIAPISTALMLVATYAFASVSIWQLAASGEAITLNLTAILCFFAAAYAILSRRISIPIVVVASAILAACMPFTVNLQP